MKNLPTFLVAVMLLAVPVVRSSAEVYLTREKAITLALPGAKETAEEKHTLSKEQKQGLEKKLGRELKESEFTFIVGKIEGKPMGYAIIVEEMGKISPFTFIVGITPDGKVREVAVMEYHEKRGSEVKDKRFLSQYKGKKASDPIALNRDIRHITGATISSQAVANGVKKALVLWEELYKSK